MLKKYLEDYEKYYYQNITSLRYSYNQYLKAIELLKNNKIEIEAIGKSFENRDIYKVKIGTGNTRVLLWSQMHGNEPISTQGLLDLLFFLTTYCDENTEIILKNLKIEAIPLLNPDGNENFERRNAQQIDINRDALRKISPEAQLLWNVIENFKPDFAFNLHDQERYYGVNNSPYPTMLSMLAPVFDNQKTVDNSRLKSMLLIANIYKSLKELTNLPIGRYSDAFIEKAFGDNVQKKGISTVLVEAGYILGDEQRQIVRKYYFLALLSGLINLSTQSYLNYSISEYNSIPLNIKQNFIDFVLKNLKIKKNGKIFATDIGIVKNILDNEKFTDMCSEFIIWEIGDLENQKAFKTIDCSDLTIDFEVKRLENAEKLINLVKNEKQINI